MFNCKFVLLQEAEADGDTEFSYIPREAATAAGHNSSGSGSTASERLAQKLQEKADTQRLAHQLANETPWEAQQRRAAERRKSKRAERELRRAAAAEQQGTSGDDDVSVSSEKVKRASAVSSDRLLTFSGVLAAGGVI